MRSRSALIALSALVPKVNSAHSSILVHSLSLVHTINLSALRGCALECIGIDVTAQGRLLITALCLDHESARDDAIDSESALG